MIVGGGVAGVSCVEELVELIRSGECGIGADIPPRVVLVCGRSGYIKVSISSEKVSIFLVVSLATIMLIGCF